MSSKFDLDHYKLAPRNDKKTEYPSPFPLPATKIGGESPPYFLANKVRGPKKKRVKNFLLEKWRKSAPGLDLNEIYQK
jgi:hypothetical protein